MKTWKLKELRDYIEQEAVERSRALQLIESIDRSIDIFRYHLFAARDENNIVENKAINCEFDFILPSSDEAIENFKRNLAIQANTQACIYTARSIHDIFAQLVNDLILFGEIPVYKCDIAVVRDKLPDSDLKNHIEAMTLSNSYKYINAFVNVIKHRNLVKYSAVLDLEMSEAGVRFDGFLYRGEKYEKKWAKEVLEISLEVKNYIVSSGEILNKQLGISSY